MSATDNAKAGLIVLAAAAVGYLGWKAWKGGAKVLTQTLNPASDQNAAYQAANAVTRAVTGDQSASLGTKIYDWLHPAASVEPSTTSSDQSAAETARLNAYNARATNDPGGFTLDPTKTWSWTPAPADNGGGSFDPATGEFIPN